MHRVRSEGVQDVLVGGDVSEEDDVVRMVQETVDELGGIDVLVNNAGIQISRPVARALPAPTSTRCSRVNLRGSFLCAREAIKHFLDERHAAASIVNVSSVHQLIPKPDYLGYSVSKGGMQNLTRTLALEYAGSGIRVNGIGPGATVTPINRAWVDDPVEARAGRRSTSRCTAPATRTRWRGVACFLASDDAAYITGQTIFVDGGLTLFADFRDALVLGVSVAVATERWWPSPFGADDQLGMLNHIDGGQAPRGAVARARRAALRPRPRPRRERARVPRAATSARRSSRRPTTRTRAMAVGANEVNWITENVSGTMQLGTHLDALCHLQIGDRGYNGWTVAELADAPRR